MPFAVASKSTSLVCLLRTGTGFLCQEGGGPSGVAVEDKYCEGPSVASQSAVPPAGVVLFPPWLCVADESPSVIAIIGAPGKLGCEP